MIAPHGCSGPVATCARSHNVFQSALVALPRLPPICSNPPAMSPGSTANGSSDRPRTCRNTWVSTKPACGSIRGGHRATRIPASSSMANPRISLWISYAVVRFKFRRNLDSVGKKSIWSMSAQNHVPVGLSSRSGTSSGSRTKSSLSSGSSEGKPESMERRNVWTSDRLKGLERGDKLGFPVAQALDWKHEALSEQRKVVMKTGFDTHGV